MGQRLLKRVDGRMMVGGDTLAIDLVFGDDSLEACLIGRRGLKAQLDGLQLLLLVARNDSVLCRTRSRERALQRDDVAAMLTFSLQQQELAFLDSFFERDEFCLSALTICGLRFERLRQPPALGLILVGQHRELQPFSDGLFDLITSRSLTFFVAHTVDLGALDGVLEPMRLRLVAEVVQQRLETVRVVLERNPLNEHGTSIVIGDDEMALERRGAVRPASRREFLPLGALGRDNAISEVGVQYGAPRSDAEEAERGNVSSQQYTLEAHTYKAGRLPLEEPTQIQRVRR
jgi:hypothetical protein